MLQDKSSTEVKFLNTNTNNNGEEIQKQKKPKRRNKSDYGDNFIAPDGGWAWLVCFAVGFSNLCIFPPLQQFGLIFRERLYSLGLTSSQITTIINTQPAVSCCTGLLNGPLFRRFSYRQVSLTGSLLISSGIMLTCFADSFFLYIMFFSIIYGLGMGINISASSVALNTYFKNRRRRAAGFSWTITGLGPIILPYVITALIPYYGVQGTVLLCGGIALHTFACGLIFQPVQWHAKTPPPSTEEKEVKDNVLEVDRVCSFCDLSKRQSTGIFSSQYLYIEDDENNPGFQITDPATPMMARANDGWYGSKLSLSSQKEPLRFRRGSSVKDIEGDDKLKGIVSQEELNSSQNYFKPNNFNRERENFKSSTSRIDLRARSEPAGGHKCTCAENDALLEKSENNTERHDKEAEEAKNSNLPFYKKIAIFFDLDLLRDLTYVNLAIGITVSAFAEMNFSILTPFILNDFGFAGDQIAMAMSLMGGADIGVRFLVPFVVEKIDWDNRVFFLIGVLGISVGRSVVAHARTFTVILVAFVWIGICKGLRTIFWPLIIPSYVPLKRLPAASGLQLLISGIFTLSCGPFVGLVRDATDYTVTLHCLNGFTYFNALSWGLEALYRRCKQKKEPKSRVED